MEIYDKEGRPIDTRTLGRLWMDRDYKVIAQEDVLTPNGDMLWVSTVWLGIDHGWGESKVPIIFETMVFGEGLADKYCERYATEAQSKTGHERVVAALKAGYDPEWGPQDAPWGPQDAP